MNFRILLIPAFAALAVVAGWLVWSTWLVQRPSNIPGPKMEQVCTFTAHCVGDLCDAALPDPVRITINGDHGRTYMGPLEGVSAQVSVIPRDGFKELAQSRGDRDGQTIYAVFDMAPDLTFAYRLTHNRIDATPLETGAGTCTDPVEVPR